MFCEDKKCPLYIECMERLEALPYCASKAAELATTDSQQLMAEIGFFVAEIDTVKHTDDLSCIAINYRDKWRKILNYS